MNDSSTISYQGKVLAISSNRVELALNDTRQAACGSCSQRAGCLSAENSSKTLQHYTLKMPTKALNIRVGDQVELQIPKKAFWMALLFAYLLPTVLAIVAMFVVNYFTKELMYQEIWIALAGIVAAFSGVVLASFVNRFYCPNVIRKLPSG